MKGLIGAKGHCEVLVDLTCQHTAAAGPAECQVVLERPFIIEALNYVLTMTTHHHRIEPHVLFYSRDATIGNIINNSTNN
jgi:hypothetical protein